MAKTGTPLLGGLAAFLFGLLTISLQPCHDFLLQKSAEYGLHVSVGTEIYIIQIDHI